MPPTFEERILELKRCLQAIASHPDFDLVLDSGYWDDETTGLSGVEEVIDRLLLAYQLTITDSPTDKH